jgi:hypothetical protein
MFRTALSGKVDGLCLTWQKSMDILPELELIVLSWKQQQQQNHAAVQSSRKLQRSSGPFCRSSLLQDSCSQMKTCALKAAQALHKIACGRLWEILDPGCGGMQGFVTRHSDQLALACCYQPVAAVD